MVVCTGFVVTEGYIVYSCLPDPYVLAARPGRLGGDGGGSEMVDILYI